MFLMVLYIYIIYINVLYIIYYIIFQLFVYLFLYYNLCVILFLKAISSSGLKPSLKVKITFRTLTDCFQVTSSF